ncbi:MAG: TonB family protein [Allosphingosinicella sp.]
MTMAAIALALLAAAPAAPARSDDEVWMLAKKANSSDAYETYLVRFPEGAHRDSADKAVDRLDRRPAVPVLMAPPPVLTLPLPSLNDPCLMLQSGQAMGTAESEEARDYLAARRANRPAGFRAYVAKYPGGACVSYMNFALRNRERLGGRVKTIARFGPLAPHRVVELTFSENDYPARALRDGESGRVVAEWEVAEDGYAEGCHVVESSGSIALDETSCRLVALRMLYDPARNRAGVPIRSTDRQAFSWVLPTD